MANINLNKDDSIPWILRDKLIYIPNDDTQNFWRLKLLFKIQLNELDNQIVNQVVKP